MKYACLSCSAKYTIPDARVEKAGASGLRVRCSRCRAIMVVSMHHGTASSDGFALASSSRPAPHGKARSKPSATHEGPAAAPMQMQMQAIVTAIDTVDSVQARAVAAFGDDALGRDDVHRPLTTGVIYNPFATLALPDDEVRANVPAASDAPPAADASAHAPARGSSSSPRIWYAAVDGKQSGPFSASEMVTLAQRGKVRGSSLLWRPGWPRWRALRSVDDMDVSWLLDVVRTRKQRELAAQQRARTQFGIQPVRIERAVVRGGQTIAPALPPDALDDDVGPGADDPAALLAMTSATPERTGWRIDPARQRRRMAGAAVAVVVALGAAIAIAWPALGQLAR